MFALAASPRPAEPRTSLEQYDMVRLTTVVLMSLLAQAALAQDSPIGEEKPSADQLSADQSTDAVKSAEKKDVPEPGDENYTPPPGFQTKKRGAITLYCKRDRETGTRFSTEKCFDKVQMREYLMALEIQKRDIDRIRATCTTASVCAPQ